MFAALSSRREVATAAVTACADQPATLGTVAHAVRGRGGPTVLIRGKPQQATNGAPMTHQAVTPTGGHRVRVTTDASGRFSARMAPGTYDVTSSASSTKVVVHAGRSASSDLRCYFPECAAQAPGRP